MCITISGLTTPNSLLVLISTYEEKYNFFLQHLCSSQGLFHRYPKSQVWKTLTTLVILFSSTNYFPWKVSSVNKKQNVILKIILKAWGFSSVARALSWKVRGYEFDPWYKKISQNVQNVEKKCRCQGSVNSIRNNCLEKFIPFSAFAEWSILWTSNLSLRVLSPVLPAGPNQCEYKNPKHKPSMCS